MQKPSTVISLVLASGLLAACGSTQTGSAKASPKISGYHYGKPVTITTLGNWKFEIKAAKPIPSVYLPRNGKSRKVANPGTVYIEIPTVVTNLQKDRRAPLSNFVLGLTAPTQDVGDFGFLAPHTTRVTHSFGISISSESGPSCNREGPMVSGKIAIPANRCFVSFNQQANPSTSHARFATPTGLYLSQSSPAATIPPDKSVKIDMYFVPANQSHTGLDAFNSKAPLSKVAMYFVPETSGNGKYGKPVQIPLG